MVIWKWEISIGYTVMMPADAQILTVQMQGQSACIWALCDRNAELKERHLAIYATGQELPEEPGEYIGTFQAHGGALVFHVFEINGG